MYRLHVAGRAAHAGLDPERGINAMVELVEQIRRVVRFADPAEGTTVTPTLAPRLTGGINRPPLESAVSVRLARLAETVRW